MGRRRPRHARRATSAATPFARLVVSSGFSNLADGVFQVALPLVALGITRDPGAFAAVTLVGRLPWLLFALPAGALADRLDRRRTMTLVNAGRAALIGALAALVATGSEGLWALYVVAFGLGVGETLFDTAAQSILPNLVTGRDELARANGRLYAVEMTANQFVGPPLGGLIVAASAGVALGGSAAAYAVAAVALTTLRGAFRPQRVGPPTRMRTDIVDGVRYLARHRILRTMAICVGLSNMSFVAAWAVLPLYAVEPGPMGLTETGYGLLLTSVAVGSLAASPLTARVQRRFGVTRSLTFALLVFPVSMIAPALTAAPAPVFVSFFLAGAVNVIWNVITVSLRQTLVPDHLLGRVNAGYRLLAWGTMPIGAAVAGVLGGPIGIRGVFWVAFGLAIACVPIFLAGVDDHSLAEAEDAAGERELEPALS